MKKKSRKLNPSKPIRIAGLAMAPRPVFILGNDLEVSVAEGSEYLIQRIIVNGRIFTPSK